MSRPDRPDRADVDLDVPAGATHILALLDSVQEQLQMIRMWADQLIAREKKLSDDQPD